MAGMWHKIRSDGSDPTPAAQRARHVERLAVDSASVHQESVTPAANERHTASLHAQSLNKSGRISFGVVTFASPYTNWYRVQLENGGTDLPCCMMSETSVLPFSVKDSSPIAPHSSVLVYHQRGLAYGIILGCLPGIVTGGVPTFSDWISQGSNGGFQRERYYSDFPQLFARAGGQIDFSNQRPLDSSAIGEWGKFSDLGGGFFLDPVMAFMRMDETCGLWMFYMDRLLRLSGHNFDFRSAVSEQQIRLDGGEASHYTASTPYGWEANGVYLPASQEVLRELSDADVHLSSPYGKLEPGLDNQMPVYRLEEFRGYEGQGYMRQLSLPDYVGGGEARTSQSYSPIGVFRQQLPLDGGWAVASAHSLTLAKRNIISVPARRFQPDDNFGDDIERSGYKFAGQYGNGPPHQISDKVPPSGDAEVPNVLSAAAVMDAAAYVFNWKGLHPFHYHVKDWAFAPPASGPQRLQRSPPFSMLSSAQYLQNFAPTSRKVDHRYEAEYYDSTSLVSLLPDGGIVIRDGYGSEVQMSGGNLTLSAPGDIVMRAGRSVIQYAGDDAIVRAHNSVDITAANHDVRLKAERNLEAMAGNGGKAGRLLLDCKASGIGNDVQGKQGEEVDQTGIVFKAIDSQILAFGHSIYLRTGDGQSSSSGGSITLDAGKGSQSIRTISRDLTAFVQNNVNFAITTEEVSKVYLFGKTSCQIPSDIQALGGLVVTKNGIQCTGNVNVLNGTVSTTSKTGTMGYLKPGSEALYITQNNIEQVGENFSNYTDALQEVYDSVTETFYESDNAPGSSRTIVNTQFAPRTPAQMRSTDYVIVASYWQQLQQAAGGGASLWNEPTITYQGEEMMPHPGQRQWDENEAFLQPVLTLYDVESGTDALLGENASVYEELSAASWNRSVPSKNYHVIT